MSDYDPVHAAYKARQDLEAEREHYVNAHTEARVKPLLDKANIEERAIEREANNLWSERIRLATEAIHAAEAAMYAARAAAAAANTGWLPEGTKVYQWERRSWSAPAFRTKIVGVVSVYRQGEKHGGGRRSWSKPRPGDVGVRLLKKDGKPGAYFVRNIIRNMWLPEGQEPESAVTPTA